jgi:hypothetical protein
MGIKLSHYAYSAHVDRACNHVPSLKENCYHQDLQNLQSSVWLLRWTVPYSGYERSEFLRVKSKALVPSCGPQDSLHKWRANNSPTIAYTGQLKWQGFIVRRKHWILQVLVELIMKHDLFDLPLQSHILDPDTSALTYKLYRAGSFLRSWYMLICSRNYQHLMEPKS